MNCTRRDFFKTAGLLGVPLLAPRLVFAADGDASSSTDTLIVIFQRGGMDGLQAVIPHADNDYYRLRPSIGIPRPGATNGAIDLDGFFGLNPAAAPLKSLYDSGRLAVVHAAGLRSQNRSHFDCQDFYERGSTNTLQVFDGWLNRYLQSNPVGEVTFGALGVGRAVQGSLRGAAPVIGLSSIANFKLVTGGGRDTAVGDTLALLYDAPSLLSRTARAALGAIGEMETANPGQNAPANGAVYPNTAFGNQMKEVAQMIKAGLGLRAACVDIGGWDHHANINNILPGLLEELSETLLAFDTDLGTAMANVSVVTMTEFGRRAFQNGSSGTDHGAASAMFVLGGGVVGGRVHARWPGLADADLFNGDLDVTTDYRQALSDLITQRLGGADLDAVFPGYAQGASTGLFLPRS
jgi:uncharacterized protein (DUF1501 family)